jgi:hypothetical protein
MWSHSDTHTLGKIPLDRGSACRRSLYLHDTQPFQETSTHAPGLIRTRNPSKRGVVGALFRPRGHRDRRVGITRNVN